MAKLLSSLTIPPGAVTFRDPETLRAHLSTLSGVEASEIGMSREGRPLFGYRFGSGPLGVSVIAGAHADEPAGPMTAQVLPLLLEVSAPDLLEAFYFRVVPQVNPDGHERNRPWFAEEPDIARYVGHTVRESPGDDIEFGYSETERARPECRAALAFLRGDAPYTAHFSLHGMAFAEGAWFLLCKAWAERGVPLLDALRAFCAEENFPLHDIERHGEKGFFRLGPGACTTPTSEGMRAHFLAMDDPETAAKFLPSSMEAVASWGGDTLCMVSELPLFLLRPERSSLEDPASARFQNALRAIAPGDKSGLRSLAAEYRIESVPFASQIRLQSAMIIAALRHVLACRNR